MTAVLDGRSVETTMGFSPLEGVPMGTRSGSIDPEIPLYLLRHGLLELDELERQLEHESGLRGLAGTDHVRGLEASEEPEARLALAVFCHRVAAAVASMVAALGGLDAIVFTAGIGEGSAAIRGEICRRLRFLGIELDERANAAVEPDADLAAPASPVRVWVVHAREDAVAARAARALL